MLDNAGLTRDDLRAMCKSGFNAKAEGMDVVPLHLPQLEHDMREYLHLLRRVHGGGLPHAQFISQSQSEANN